MPNKFDEISSESGQIHIAKIKTIIQNVDFYLAGRTAGLFIIGNARTKFRAYSVPQFKRYNEEPVIAALDAVFNPSKNSPLEIINEQTFVQSYVDMKYRSTEKNSMPYRRFIFWMLFSAAVNDEIYNYELPNIIDLAYCFDFDEKLLRDWCKAVNFVATNGKIDKNSPLKLETETGKKFFLK
jgi:hypothetical protein